MPRVNIVLDATMFDTFELCPAKYNYRFNHNKTVATKPTGLDRGTLVHAGLETYYTGLAAGASFKFCVDTMIRDMEVAIAADSDLEPSEAARCIEVMIEYVNHWRTEDQNLKIKSIEKPFSYVLYEDESVRIIMIGKIDLLIDDHLYNNLPYDHKTYDRDFPLRRLVNQFCNYTLATGSNYLIVNRIGFQKTVAAEKKFKRVPLSYDPLILQQWKENTVNRIINYYLPAVAEGRWDMNLTSCDKFNRLCEYYEVCDSSGIEAKTYKLEANFKTAEKWDVSRVLGGKKG